MKSGNRDGIVKLRRRRERKIEEGIVGGIKGQGGKFMEFAIDVV